MQLNSYLPEKISLVQGQGSHTEAKERGIQATLEASLRVAKPNLKNKYNYYHIDLHSGSGYNEKVGCDGSPVAFLNATDKVNVSRYKAFFIEKDAGNASRLRHRPGVLNNDRVEVIEGDNRDGLNYVMQKLAKANEEPRFMLGSVLCDPNGYFGRSVPHLQMESFFRTFVRFDIILNLNITQFKRQRGLVEQGSKGWGDRFNPYPSTLPRVFNKEHWYVRRALGSGHRFIMMVGRNFDLQRNAHEKAGFHRIESADGQLILRNAERHGDTSRLALS